MAGVAGASGDDDGVALRGAGDVEGAVELEEGAAVVDGVLRGRVEVLAGGAVEGEGVVVPAVPELADDVDELAGAAVAVGVGGELGVAEVAGGVVVGGGDDVPGGAAAADVVERGELAGDVVGLGEAGGDGAAEADARGGAGEGGEEGDGLEDVHEQREAGPGMEVVGAGGGGVGDEEEVEQAAFGGAGGFGVGGEVGGWGEGRFGVEPTGRVRPGGAEQEGERHAAVRHGSGGFLWCDGTMNF